jgi:LPS export ABC transporter permease LptF/LPS export ABC transporter permease LptG
LRGRECGPGNERGDTLEEKPFSPFMRIFTRYILREVVSHALLGGALFTFVLFIGRLGKIVDLVVRDSASLSEIAKIFAFLLPDALTFAIPMAVLVGILLGLSRLAADSEITAMRACGMSALDFVRIVSIAALIALSVGLVNSLYLAPRSASALLALEDELKTTQASFEVQPRVFYEDFKNIVLYVQDVTPAAGVAVWRHVFVADLTKPGNPDITTADSAVVVSGADDAAKSGEDAGVRMHLKDGGQHKVSDTDPNGYDVSSFGTYDMRLQPSAQDDAHISRLDAPLLALPLRDLYRKATSGGESATRQYRIELNRRLSYPFACLVLMLVGVPLGLSSKRGGKSMGFVLTIVLVFIYYFMSSMGVALAKQQKLSPFVGVWGANMLFAAIGLVLLQEMSRGDMVLAAVSSVGARLAAMLPGRLGPKGDEATGAQRQNLETAIVSRLRRLRSMLRIRFPLLLDEYVMKAFGQNFLIVLMSLVSIVMIFTFFDLVGDIVRNRTPLVTVAEYLLNLVPYILDRVIPFCALVGALLTFGGLSRTSELTAMKATGISIYRIVTPVLVLTLLISAGLFAFDEQILPAANRQQEALRSIIKGKPAQTFLRPERKWMSGMGAAAQQAAGAGSEAADGTVTPGATEARENPARIFYYEFFDPVRNVFAKLSVFEFQPDTFRLQRRIFAESARWDERVGRWVFDEGWQRTFAGETVASYQPFTVQTFPEIREQPGWFKKEDLQSQEMNYGELERYISDLQQSGFPDTIVLRVQLNHKLAYPLMTFIMGLLAIPFALSMGKRGGLAGMATAIGIAILYYVISNTFEAMGNVNWLPPMLAAWTPDVLFGFAGAYLLLRTPT